MANPKQHIYDEAEAVRDKQTSDILASAARKKIIVAGPGTGKTYLFQQLLKQRPGDCLTLTFINALVDELSLSLSGLSADSDEGNQYSGLIVISIPGWCDQSSERSDAGFCIL